MRLKAYYAIQHKGSDKLRWVYFEGMGWRLQDDFEPNCLVTRNRASQFLRQPGIDSRFGLVTVRMRGEIHA